MDPATWWWWDGTRWTVTSRWEPDPVDPATWWCWDGGRWTRWYVDPRDHTWWSWDGAGWTASPPSTSTAWVTVPQRQPLVQPAGLLVTTFFVLTALGVLPSYLASEWGWATDAKGCPIDSRVTDVTFVLWLAGILVAAGAAVLASRWRKRHGGEPEPGVWSLPPEAAARDGRPQELVLAVLFAGALVLPWLLLAVVQANCLP